jgi:hypothetical protein
MVTCVTLQQFMKKRRYMLVTNIFNQILLKILHMHKKNFLVYNMTFHQMYYLNMKKKCI